MGFSGTPKDMGPPYGKRDPYYSHIFRDYHQGVPLLGVPGITLEFVPILKGPNSLLGPQGRFFSVIF